MNQVSHSELRYSEAKDSFNRLLANQDCICRELKDTGLGIIRGIEALKNGSPKFDTKGLTIDDLARTLEALYDFALLNNNATHIGVLLTQLNAKIATEEHVKLVSKICLFVALCVMIAALSLIGFCIASHNKLNGYLIPVAGVALCLLPLLIIRIPNMIHGDDVMKVIEKDAYTSLSHYFFKSSTKGSEDARKIVSVLNECYTVKAMPNPVL